MIVFDEPKEQSSILKVIGVGGGGSNAVNHMFSQNIEGVNFIICNTDAQAIALSKVPNKIQLGPHLTQGLGAGADPAIGKQATEESLEEIKRILEVNTKMAFITAGMGGGTGTGGAPILAKICKDLGILTVGIVTTPFAFEGKKRLAQAEEGIRQLKDHVDTLLVISNDKVRHQFGNLKMKEAFAKADNVLATAAKCITDVINSTGQINVDFADVCTVMTNGGVAILGNATAEGENRAQIAIENALRSPLLNDNDIRGAKWILININSSEGDHEFTMDEVDIIQDYLMSQAGPDSDVILGLGYDNTLGAEISITLIATGFEHKDPFAKTINLPKEQKKEVDKIVMALGTPEKEVPKMQQHKLQFTEMEEYKSEINAGEKTVIKPVEIIVAPLVNDSMMPTLSVPETAAVTTPVVNADRIFFEMDEPATQVQVVEFDRPQPPVAGDNGKTVFALDHKDLPAGAFLAKPSNIYVEEQAAIPQVKAAAEVPAPMAMRNYVAEPNPAFDMQMVVKEFPASKETQQAKPQPTAVAPTPQQAPSSVMLPRVEEQPGLHNDTDDLRKRAMDRIAKLRNLSFNINAADPNNEYETVPAYLRRNTELNNSAADVESFYSNYTVKSGENNQAEIGTINSFLDGKKPD